MSRSVLLVESASEARSCSMFLAPCTSGTLRCRVVNASMIPTIKSFRSTQEKILRIVKTFKYSFRRRKRSMPFWGQTSGSFAKLSPRPLGLTRPPKLSLSPHRPRKFRLHVQEVAVIASWNGKYSRCILVYLHRPSRHCEHINIHELTNILRVVLSRQRIDNVLLAGITRRRIW